MKPVHINRYYVCDTEDVHVYTREQMLPITARVVVINYSKLRIYATSIQNKTTLYSIIHLCVYVSGSLKASRSDITEKPS